MARASIDHPIGHGLIPRLAATAALGLYARATDPLPLPPPVPVNPFPADCYLTPDGTGYYVTPDGTEYYAQPA